MCTCSAVVLLISVSEEMVLSCVFYRLKELFIGTVHLFIGTDPLSVPVFGVCGVGLWF